MPAALRAAAAALIALVWVGCSTDQSGAVMPGVRLTDLRRVLVECRPQDDAGLCELLARDLRGRGWAVETSGSGESGRAQVDAVVSYEDRWMWDVSMYLLTLRLDVRDPRTNVLLATAHVYRTSLARSTPEEMVRRAVDSLFAAQG